MSQKIIIERLKALEDLKGVSVKVTGSTKGTIRIAHKKHHAPEFQFKWVKDHYVGHFIDSNQTKSQAVVSLRNALEAIHFVSAYITLNSIRANQK